VFERSIKDQILKDLGTKVVLVSGPASPEKRHKQMGAGVKPIQIVNYDRLELAEEAGYLRGS
jgi:hypothetical protein